MVLLSGSQTRFFPCAMQHVYTCARGCRMSWGGSPPRTHVSHLVSDTDHPFLQCGGCEHRIRHRYRPAKGQVELRKSIIDTNSCKYSFLCCYYNYFLSKSQGKSNCFMPNCGKVFVAEAIVSCPLSPLPPAGHCRQFLSPSKAS